MSFNPDHREIEAREKSELATENTRPGRVFRPDVDILERADAYVIQADLPGVTDDSVDIHLDKGVLTLDARTVADSNAESPRPVHAEYQSGGYHREFRISEDIDPGAVTAKMEDGVLELLLPKSAKNQPRRIAVAGA
jgi:HSP20 family protein